MDLQTRKLKAIRYLIGIRDEKLFRRIESTINETRQQQERLKMDIEPLTENEIIDRAHRSNHEYKKGFVKTQDQLEDESKEW